MDSAFILGGASDKLPALVDQRIVIRELSPAQRGVPEPVRSQRQLPIRKVLTNPGVNGSGTAGEIRRRSPLFRLYGSGDPHEEKKQQKNKQKRDSKYFLHRKSSQN